MAGDVLDVATVAMRARRPRGGRLGWALLALAGVDALDPYAATRSSTARPLMSR